MANHPNLVSTPLTVVTSISEFLSLSSAVPEIVFDEDTTGTETEGVLDFSRFHKVKRIVFMDYSFSYAYKVEISSLNELESVVVGTNSLTQNVDSYPVFTMTSRQFYLKNCPKLKTLQIGRFSFSDYNVCEMTLLPSLETIEMGEVGRESYNFYHASLELKRIRQCAVRYV